MNLTIEKIFTILAVIFVILFINHISAGGVRSYIWEGTNRRFANKLENCRRYTTPTTYRAPIIVPVDKYQTRIIGKRDDACVIRAYYAEPLAPFKHYYEYRLPFDVTKDVAEVLKLAFKEPRGKEKKAAKLASQFGIKYKKYSVSYKYEEDTRRFQDDGGFHDFQRHIRDYVGKFATQYDPEYERELKKELERIEHEKNLNFI